MEYRYYGGIDSTVVCCNPASRVCTTPQSVWVWPTLIPNCWELEGVNYAHGHFNWAIGPSCSCATTMIHQAQVNA